MNIDIELAWQRLKKDMKEKHFVSPLYLVDVLESNCTSWLPELKERIESKRNTPHPMEVVEIPKGRGLIRPGSLLNIEDNLAYFGLVQECYLAILNQIKWSQNVVDFSHIITPENVSSSDWFKGQLFGWNEFREQTLKKIREGYQYIIVTDLTGFYENIDIQVLSSDLRAAGIESGIVSELSRYLNKWTQVSNKGLPQSNSASDLLAKLYLDSVDQGLKNAGFIHLRYVDDIRIFCNNINEAKKALIELTRLLRKRGLNIQSGKTKILNANEAYIEVEGIQPIIGIVGQRFKEEMKAFELSSAYYDVEDESDEKQEQIPIAIIKQTFITYFVQGTDSNFDKTLFHYLMNRLIQELDGSFLDYCLSLLERHPEETSYILKYSRSFDEFDIDILGHLKSMQTYLLNFLNSEEAVYNYQNYKILLWFEDNIDTVEDKILIICRHYAFDNNRPYYLRSIARRILGRFGNIADFEKLEDQLSHISSDMERAELLCCLSKLEKGKRNAILGKYSKDGPFTEMAIPFIKGL